MDTLPIEILSSVMKYLSVEDRCSAVLVSKSWYEAACRAENLKDISITFDANCLKKGLISSFVDAVHLIELNRRFVNVLFRSFPIGNQPTVIINKHSQQRQQQSDTSNLNQLNPNSPVSDISDQKFDSVNNNSSFIRNRCTSDSYPVDEINSSKWKNKSTENVERELKTCSPLCGLSRLRSLNITGHCAERDVNFNGRNLALMLQCCSQLKELRLHLCDSVFDRHTTGVGFEALNDASRPCNCRENALGGHTCLNCTAALSSLQHLSVNLSSQCSDRHLGVLLRHAPKLRRLSIGGTRLRSEDDDKQSDKMSVKYVIDWVSIKANQLTSLHLYQCVDNSVVEKLISCADLSLQSVAFTFCERLTDKGVIAIASQQTELKTLNLAGCENITDYALAAIKRLLRKLKDLTLDYTKVTGGPVSNFYPAKKAISAADAPKLKFLSLMCCDVTRSTFWLRSLKKCLISLNLSSCPVDDDWFSALPAWVTNLRELRINNTRISTKGASAIFNNLLDLRVLEMARCALLTDEALLGCQAPEVQHSDPTTNNSSLERSAKSWPRVDPPTTLRSLADERRSLSALTNLKSLDLSECAQLTDASLSRLLHFDQLRWLALRGLDKIRVDTLDAAWSGCPRLRKLYSPWSKRGESEKVVEFNIQ